MNYKIIDDKIFKIFQNLPLQFVIVVYYEVPDEGEPDCHLGEVWQLLLPVVSL